MDTYFLDLSIILKKIKRKLIKTPKKLMIKEVINKTPIYIPTTIMCLLITMVFTFFAPPLTYKFGWGTLPLTFSLNILLTLYPLQLLSKKNPLLIYFLLFPFRMIGMVMCTYFFYTHFEPTTLIFILHSFVTFIIFQSLEITYLLNESH